MPPLSTPLLLPIVLPPQRPGPPPPQNSGLAQSDPDGAPAPVQVVVCPPHPSPWIPHVPAGKAAQVVGTHGVSVPPSGASVESPHLL
jgi:hypothetical protein